MKFKLRIHSDEMSTSFDRTLAIFIFNFIFIFLFQLKIGNCYSFSEKKKKEILLNIKKTYQDYNYVFFFLTKKMNMNDNLII
jgi:predicted transporter